MAKILVSGLIKEAGVPIATDVHTIANLEDPYNQDFMAAAYSRPVVNSIGAGDALFSAFVHGYLQARDPYAAPRRAVVFAAYKTGEKGGAGPYRRPGPL